MKKFFNLSIYLYIFISINISNAQEFNVFKEDMVEVSFISSVTKVTEEKFYLGLEFKLEPGWKIYWRQPGDSGMPPQGVWARAPYDATAYSDDCGCACSAGCIEATKCISSHFRGTPRFK